MNESIDSLIWNLYELRLDHDLTQKELSDKTKISVRTLRDYENVKQKPSIDNLKKLCDVYGIEIIWRKKG